MSQYPEGLNFVPLLEKQISPPTSSRSRVSLTKKVSQKSFVYYNGNYEGDCSMFKENGFLELKHTNLLAENTDSETELERNLADYRAPQMVVNSPRMIMRENQVWRLIHFYMMRFLPSSFVLKITQCLETIYGSAVDGRIRRGALYIKTVLLWIFHLLMVIVSRITCMSSVLWKSRTFFRNATRRLLWWMTLAKCNDLWLFALILFCTPFLFLLAIIGFVISLYCALKEGLQRSGGFLRKRVF